MKTVGLIINPIAGMGGKVGLKGSDGEEILRKAIELGASPESPAKAGYALDELKRLSGDIEFYTCSGEMGEDVLRELGYRHTVLYSYNGVSKPEDTIEAAKILAQKKLDILMFAGGDGTARNVCSAVGTSTVVIGIPAGVKIHSAVYAQTPRSAGRMATLFLDGKKHEVHEAEVMDIDEEAFRQGRVSAKLYGYMRVPAEHHFMQNLKSGGVAGEKTSLTAIARDVVSNMKPDYIYIIGPGTSTRPIMDFLGLESTLLGVDLVCNRQLLKKDVAEAEILEAIQGRKAKIVVTVIGGQGYVFGRGNQQISAKVIQQVQKENIIIVATKDKLATVIGCPLLVDTGDPATDRYLEGYYRITAGFEDMVMFKVQSSG